MNTASIPNGLQSLRFDNRFTRALPADPQTGPARRQIRDACFSRIDPTPVAAPALVAYSREVAEMLERDMATSELLDPTTFKDRSWFWRFSVNFARLWAPVL